MSCERSHRVAALIPIDTIKAANPKPEKPKAPVGDWRT
jgi:hypothetical protein